MAEHVETPEEQSEPTVMDRLTEHKNRLFASARTAEKEGQERGHKLWEYIQRWRDVSPEDVSDAEFKIMMNTRDYDRPSERFKNQAYSEKPLPESDITSRLKRVEGYLPSFAHESWGSTLYSALWQTRNKIKNRTLDKDSYNRIMDAETPKELFKELTGYTVMKNIGRQSPLNISVGVGLGTLALLLGTIQQEGCVSSRSDIITPEKLRAQRAIVYFLGDEISVIDEDRDGSVDCVVRDWGDTSSRLLYAKPEQEDGIRCKGNYTNGVQELTPELEAIFTAEKQAEEAVLSVLYDAE